MKFRQNPTVKRALTAAACALATGFAGSIMAQPATVTDVTDWSTTPVETVSVSDPYLGYTGGGIFAGINTLAVTVNSVTTDANGFCIDPFHWSVSGPQAYTIEPLVDAPKSPAQLNAYTANEIADLWAEFYSPTMSSPNAAGLQIAIWELVSSNAIASDGLPSADAFVVTGPSTYSATADLASLATYSGPAANVEALSGPGQDYVIATLATMPDGGETLLMLGIAFGVLIIAKPALIKTIERARRTQVVRVRVRCHRR